MTTCRSRHFCCDVPVWVSLFLLLVDQGVSLDVRGKPAEQSTTGTEPGYPNLEAGASVDGNINTFAHTDWAPRSESWDGLLDPWWRVDLEAVYCVRKITITNRMDYVLEVARLSGAEVRAGIKPDYDQSDLIGTVQPDQVLLDVKQVVQFIAEPAVSARYLSVYLNGTNKYIHMSEFMVEEFIDEQAVAANAISLSGSVITQSSTYTSSEDSFEASRAINRDFQYDLAHCSRTNSEMNPWWKIDLMSDQCVGKILVKGNDATFTTGRTILEGATIRAGISRNLTDNAMCGSPVSEYQAIANNWIEFECNPPYGVTARYISININRTTSLTLCEVIPLPCDLPQGDFTFVASHAFLGSTGDDDAALTAYKGPTDIGAGVSFGRQLATGGGSGLPQGSAEESDSSLGCAARRLQLPATGGMDRTGVLYFDVWEDSGVTRIQTVILPKDDTVVHIRPAQRTQAANIGDSVTLEMRNINAPNSNYRWKHNEASMPSWDNQLSVSIADVTRSHGGVYSCFIGGLENQQLHGIMRLIVRGCPAGMWGPPACLSPCRQCYNGGVCNEKTGTCICSPGFSGVKCEKVHGRNVFGQGASHRCSDTTDPHDSACRGRLFCFPDPYGCSCAAGYMGLDCMQECPVGMYGADCKQTCHCASGVTCNKDTGECTNGACDSQYYGINCQCSKETEVALIATIVTRTSLTFSWRKPTCGIRNEPITKYKYKLTSASSGLVIRLYVTTKKTATIDDLLPYTEYSFQVDGLTSTNTVAAISSQVFTVWTREAEPTAPLDVTIVNVDNVSITVTWSAPDQPNGNITNYDISYWTSANMESPTVVSIGWQSLKHRIQDPETSVLYYVKIRAKTSVGAGPWSETVQAFTQIGVPGVVRDLRSTNVTETLISLEWEDPIDPNGQITGYVVEYRIIGNTDDSASEAGPEFRKTDVTAPRYHRETFEPGTKYEFRVSARNQLYTGLASVLKVTTKARNGFGVGVIIGIVIGVVFILAAVAIVGCLLWKGRKGQNTSSNKERVLPKTTQVEMHGIDKPDYVSQNDDDNQNDGARQDDHDYEDVDVGLPAWATKLEIKWENLHLTDTFLGKGNFGEVRAGNVLNNGRVIKAAIKTHKAGAIANAADAFMLEFKTMAKIKKHPNVVCLLGACLHEGSLYVALEFLPKGNLRDYLRKTRPMQTPKQTPGQDAGVLTTPGQDAGVLTTPGQDAGVLTTPGQDAGVLTTPGQDAGVLTASNLMSFGTNVARGMEHLSNSGIIHRDLAARNILLAEDLTAKVSDFGLSRGEDIGLYVQTSMTRVPLRWLAIESLTDRVYETKSDVWSFGILLWEIATFGATPYPGIETRSLAKKLLDGYRMPKPENCAQQVYDLMMKCWQEERTERPNFKQLVADLEQMANEPLDDSVYLVPYINVDHVIQPEFDDN